MRRQFFSPAFITTALIFTFEMAHACVNMLDQHSSGVILNSNEGFFPDRFDSLGKEGIHFFRDCGDIINPNTLSKDIQIITPTIDLPNWTDPFSVLNVSVTGNIMEIEVSYGGGCRTHEFRLYANPFLAYSDPPLINFTLLHNADGDVCKALITETLIFNLKPLEKIVFGSSALFIQLSIPNIKYSRILWYPDNTCSIRYRSHFYPAAMVYLEHIHVTESRTFPSLRIITDPEVQFVQPFEYDKAVITELQWLISNNIVRGLPEETLSRIEETMRNKQGQYWTFQDSLIGYNGNFSLTKDSSGVWKWGDAVFIRDPKDCGSTLVFSLPDDSLGYNTATLPGTNLSKRSGRFFTVNPVNGMLLVNISDPALTGASIGMFDLKGRLLYKTVLMANQNHFMMQMPPNSGKGMYKMVLRSKAGVQSSTVIITE